MRNKYRAKPNTKTSEEFIAELREKFPKRKLAACARENCTTRYLASRYSPLDNAYVCSTCHQRESRDIVRNTSNAVFKENKKGRPVKAKPEPPKPTEQPRRTYADLPTPKTLEMGPAVPIQVDESVREQQMHLIRRMHTLSHQLNALSNDMFAFVSKNLVITKVNL